MIYIVSGDIGIGKSYALMEWAKGRLDVSGIVSPRMEQEIRYFYDLKSRERFKMETSSDDEQTISVGRYHFSEAAFRRANNCIQAAIENYTDGFVLIDELGKLELREEGLHEAAKVAIERAAHHTKLHLVVVVRTSLLAEIVMKYDIKNYEVVHKNELTDKLIATV